MPKSHTYLSTSRLKPHSRAVVVWWVMISCVAFLLAGCTAATADTSRLTPTASATHAPTDAVTEEVTGGSDTEVTEESPTIDAGAGDGPTDIATQSSIAAPTDSTAEPTLSLTQIASYPI